MLICPVKEAMAANAEPLEAKASTSRIALIRVHVI
jgi:hypothetical protein